MKIGIIGSGNVGGTLGKLFAAKGHEILFGMRDPNKVRPEAAEAIAQSSAQKGTLQQAVDFGEVVILAIPGNTAPDTVASLQNWSGKIVIDTNNRFGPSTSGLSLAEDTAQRIPGAHVVKAFNTIGTSRYDSPEINGQTVSMFICGDDSQAKSVVGGLVNELGFDLVDIGELSQAILLENMARLWVSLSRSNFGRDIGFKLLR